MLCGSRGTPGPAAGTGLPGDSECLISIRHGVRRPLLRAGLLAAAMTAMVAGASVAASTTSRGPAVVSSAAATGFESPASSCGNHPCVL